MDMAGRLRAVNLGTCSRCPANSWASNCQETIGNCAMRASGQNNRSRDASALSITTTFIRI
jgi:hypothetical protein